MTKDSKFIDLKSVPCPLNVVKCKLALEKLSKQVGIELGSGYPADPLTKIAIRELCNLEMPHECLRWSWSNVKRVWIEENKRPLPKRYLDEGEKTQTAIHEWK